jgi:uncharacterized membrane protein YdjX (TVP38/TMEM64 family)
MRPITRNKKIRWFLLGFTAVAFIAVGIAFSGRVDWAGLRTSMENMHKVPLLILVSVLPLIGFSIGITYLVLGAVFGGWLGLAVVAGITAIHLLGSHWIARSFLRGPLERYLKKRKKHLPELPEGEEWSVALMTALVPGLPYFVRNYLLALSGIPLRTYFWICWPVYVVRSILVIFLGDFSGDFSAQRVGVLGAVLLVKLGICAYLIHRLRKRSHNRKRPGAASHPRTSRPPELVKNAR